MQTKSKLCRGIPTLFHAKQHVHNHTPTFLSTITTSSVKTFSYIRLPIFGFYSYSLEFERREDSTNFYILHILLARLTISMSSIDHATFI